MMFWELVVLWGILLFGLASHHAKQNLENEHTRSLIRGVHNRLTKIEIELGIKPRGSASTMIKEVEE